METDVGGKSYTLISQNRVQRITSSSFNLDDDMRISLKWKDCIVIIFYTETKECLDVFKMFSLAAQKLVGVVMGACNLEVETEVARAFTEIGQKRSHPLHWARLKTYPFILTYRDGWPNSFYNGDRSLEAFVNYCILLACSSDHYEKYNTFGGVSIEDNMEVNAVPRYPSDTNPVRSQSSDFVTGKPVHPYGVKSSVGSESSSDTSDSEKEDEEAPPPPSEIDIQGQDSKYQ